MAHKVHPKAYRIRRIADWDSRGFYKNTAREVEEDFRIREFINKKIGKLGIEKVEIERFPGRINVIINSAKPGLIIGRGGEGVERLKKELAVEMKKVYVSSLIDGFEAKRKLDKKISQGKETKSDRKDEGEKNKQNEIRLEIREIKDYWTSAPLVGQWVAQQIEKRMPFRKILKQGISKVMANKIAKGVRIEVSGRLNGSEIARREWLANGRMPRQTLRADIDYATVEAHCTYGVIGVKIWVYKGDKFE